MLACTCCSPAAELSSAETTSSASVFEPRASAESAFSAPVSSVGVSSAGATFVETPSAEPFSDTAEPDEIRVFLSADEVRSGEAIVLRMEGYDGELSRLRVYYSKTSSRKYPLFAGNGFAFAIVPVNSTASGLGALTVADTETGETLFSRKVTLLPRSYERQDLTVAPGSSMETSGSSQNLDSDKAVIRQVTSSSAQKLLFSGSFVMPVSGRISTQYGQRRYTNGKYTSAHSGYDIAAAEGTPVVAAGSGTVVYSGELKFYGKTVIIDHGLGIYSYYNHMSETVVGDNQPIETGQPIGEVGSTGYSTGPHLHFNVSVGGTNVDPELFMSGDSIYQQLERMISQ